MDAVLLRGGGKKTIHQWKKYNVNTSTTYWWNTYNLVNTTTYKWNKYNRVSTTTYTWNKWNVEKVAPVTHGGAENGIDLSPPFWQSYKFSTDYRNRAMVVGDGAKSADSYEADAPGTKYHGWFARWSFSSTSIMDSVVYCIDKLGSEYTQSSGTGLFYYRNSSIQYSIGVKDGYSVTKVDGKGSTSYGTVSSTSSTAYPNDGAQDGYWYDNRTSSTTYSKGTTFYGTVSSTSSSAYPSNGYSGSYWYVSAGSSTSYSKGSTSYGYVTSSSRNTYPDNSWSGSKWYVYDNSPTYSYSQGSYIEDILSTDPNKYPANGISGSFWYVYQGQL